MDQKINESDWKIFCKIKEIAEERFCEQSVKEYKESIEDESKSYVERDVYIQRLSKNRNEHYNAIFGARHARSQMVFQLFAIRMNDLVDQEMLSMLSEDMLERTDPERVK